MRYLAVLLAVLGLACSNAEPQTSEPAPTATFQVVSNESRCWVRFTVTAPGEWTLTRRLEGTLNGKPFRVLEGSEQFTDSLTVERTLIDFEGPLTFEWTAFGGGSPVRNIERGEC